MFDPRPIQAAERVAQAYLIIREFDAAQPNEHQHDQLLDRLFESIVELETLAGGTLGPIAREVLGHGEGPVPRA